MGGRNGLGKCEELLLDCSLLGIRVASVGIPDLCGDQQRVESFRKAEENVGENVWHSLWPRELVAILVSA